MGSRPAPDAVSAQWPTQPPPAKVVGMTQQSPRPAAEEAATGVILTAAGYDELARELEQVRSTHRTELAQRLRDARTFGSPGDDDEWLAALEDTAVDRVRIAQLERLLATATVVDESPSSDGAALGSLVWVQDDAGRAAQYQLVGRRAAEGNGGQVSLASPVGKALRGARAGDVVQVELPNGRTRSLTVLDVRSGSQELAA
jgi:transcription elongation factor GreA